MINLAIIGGGYISDFHARAVQKLPGARICTVVAKDLAIARAFADRYQVRDVDTAESLNARPDIDAAIIATPNKFHAPYALSALERNRDVFLEKPMAINYEEAVEIEKSALSNQQMVMVGHMWRFDPEVQAVKKVIGSDSLGKIIKTRGFGIHTNWGPEGWFTDRSLAGGGALIDMGVHAIDTARYLLGDPKPAEVYAKLNTHFGNYNVDDTGVVFITWDNGSHSIIESGWWQPHADGPEAATRIYGTKGYASVFPSHYKKIENGKMRDYKIPGMEREEHCDQSLYDAQMVHFLQSIISRKMPSPGPDEGKTIMRIVDAAYRSSAENTVVKL